MGFGGLVVFRSCPWGPGSGRPCHPRPVAFGLPEKAGVVCEYCAPPPAKFWVSRGNYTLLNPSIMVLACNGWGKNFVQFRYLGFSRILDEKGGLGGWSFP